MIFLSGCERAHYFKDAEDTNLSGEQINGIKLHTSIDDPLLAKQYGDRIKKVSYQTKYNYYNLSDSLEIATNDEGEIVRIIIRGNDAKTSKDITLNSKKDDVISKYGNNFYKRTEQGVDIIGYVDRDNNSTLEFWIDEDERVVEIRYDDINIQ